MKLVVGLGNPGPRYETTRHNVGFMVVDLVADQLDLTFKKNNGMEVAEGRIGLEKIIILKPLTYMNLSGQAVQVLVNYYKLSPEDILVVYDDMDIDVGRIRIKPSGRAGGHKGINSIIQLLGTHQIARVKVGIGRPGPQTVVDYVLTPFADAEWETMKAAIFRAAEAVHTWAKEGVVPTMNKYNGNTSA